MIADQIIDENGSFLEAPNGAKHDVTISEERFSSLFLNFSSVSVERHEVSVFESFEDKPK